MLFNKWGVFAFFIGGGIQVPFSQAISLFGNNSFFLFGT
jgi:hypothetical protein